MSTPMEPPAGYDVGKVAAAARRADPGLPLETAELLAAEAGGHLATGADVDAPEVARRLLAEHPESGASAAAVVGRAAAVEGTD